MKRSTTSALAFISAAGALFALQAGAAETIDWSQVPGNLGNSNVTQSFIQAPDTLNSDLTNSFTAWYPQQWAIEGAKTPQGRAQRLAVLGTAGAPQTTAANEESMTTSQAAPAYGVPEGSSNYTENQPGTSCTPSDQ